MDLKASLDQPVSSFMDKELESLEENEVAARAAKAMAQGEVDAIVVRAKGKPTGIVTERDILYKVVAEGKDPSIVVLSTIMSSPLLTVEHGTKAGDAIAMMAKSGVRRLGVTRGGTLIGIVTQRSIVSGGQHVPLPELERAGTLRCPYCQEEVGDQDQLSRHIDTMHIGLGLLEGDARKL